MTEIDDVLTEKSQLSLLSQSEAPSVCQLFSAFVFADIGLAGVTSEGGVLGRACHLN